MEKVLKKNRYILLLPGTRYAMLIYMRYKLTNLIAGAALMLMMACTGYVVAQFGLFVIHSAL